MEYRQNWYRTRTEMEHRKKEDGAKQVDLSIGKRKTEIDKT